LARKPDWAALALALPELRGLRTRPPAPRSKLPKDEARFPLIPRTALQIPLGGKDFRVEPHAYGAFPAATIPSTSLGSAGVCLGNTRALVACSKS
jgi:hypothetical protein